MMSDWGQRQCPCCGSHGHTALVGITGLYLACNRCSVILANRQDAEAAPTTMTDEQAEEWARKLSGVMEGAESLNPEDDEIFGPNRWPVPFLAF